MRKTLICSFLILGIHFNLKQLIKYNSEPENPVFRNETTVTIVYFIILSKPQFQDSLWATYNHRLDAPLLSCSSSFTWNMFLPQCLGLSFPFFLQYAILSSFPLIIYLSPSGIYKIILPLKSPPLWNFSWSIHTTLTIRQCFLSHHSHFT